MDHLRLESCTQPWMTLQLHHPSMQGFSPPFSSISSILSYQTSWTWDGFYIAPTAAPAPPHCACGGDGCAGAAEGR
eukprot:2561346-Rhodomonas_salina.1